MTDAKLKEAIAEAKRFITRAEALLQTAHAQSSWRVPKESGAARRSSLDLTRALAELCKS